MVFVEQDTLFISAPQKITLKILTVMSQKENSRKIGTATINNRSEIKIIKN